jgi:serine/threonine-protein kinase ATR
MTPTKKTRTSPQAQTAEEYLVDNMLAVMTQLNEILHEMHGKKSVDSKRQIIRSLGPLISYIGKAIGGIGLQVPLLILRLVSDSYMYNRSWRPYKLR